MLCKVGLLWCVLAGPCLLSGGAIARGRGGVDTVHISLSLLTAFRSLGSSTVCRAIPKKERAALLAARKSLSQIPRLEMHLAAKDVRELHSTRVIEHVCETIELSGMRGAC